MEIEYALQPFSQNGSFMLGSVLQEFLEKQEPFYDKNWLVSFSLKRSGIIRILPSIKDSIKKGAKIHFVIGIDLDSSSLEALSELLELDVDAKIVHSKPDRRGSTHTFHPKIYLFESSGKRADLFIGSSNLTGGGMYSNFECNIHMSFNLSGEDNKIYEEHKRALEPFINPSGTIVQKLTKDLLNTLVKSGDVRSEFTTRETVRRSRRRTKPVDTPFGSSLFPEIPLIPTEYQKRLIQEAKKKPRKISSIVSINAFYIQLNKLQGLTIPGEVRVPLATRNMDENFWGWPQQYKTIYRQRGKIRRRYKGRITKWNIIDTDNPTNIILDNHVRMYGYAERGEFRFYSNQLVKMGADEFDIIRLTLSSDPKTDFQCELARKSSSKYGAWLNYCTIPIPNSKRKFGFS